MANLVIRPASGAGNKVVVQDQAGAAVLTTADSGATIASATLTSPTINTPTINTPTITGAATFSGDLVPSTPLSHRNMIINGGMQVDQRKGGAIAGNEGAQDNRYVTVDRYRDVLNCGDARLSLQQVDITDLAGFPHALKIDCTVTGGTPSSAEYVIIKQRLEGQNVQQLEKGFSSAKPTTLSFWVKGSASRTYVVELRDTSSTARSASQQFSVTTSWVKHTYTFPGDTGGDKINNDANLGLEVNFWLSAGSNFTSGSYTASTWANHTDATTAVGISGSGSGILTTTSDELYITGVQLELGSNATPFEHRSYGDELARCQRYYETSTQPTWGFPIHMNSTSYRRSVIWFKVPKRATPTIAAVSAPNSHSPSTQSIGTGGFTGTWSSVPSSTYVETASWTALSEL